MNGSEIYSDIVDDFVKSSGLEKAPGGFTQNVMQQVYLEKNVYKPVLKKNYVPVITASITAVLVSASLLLSPGTPGILDRILPSIKLNLEFPDLDKLIVLPKTVLYVIAGIVILTCFDVLLRAFFHRKKSE